MNIKPWERWRNLGALIQKGKLLSIALGVTGAVLGLQFTGSLQLLEWVVLDQWFRLRPPEALSIPITLITISEADISSLKHWPISDARLAELLRQIKQARPALIGLDLYRNLPVPPGHAELQQVFSTTPNLIGIQQAIGNGNGTDPAVPPPPKLQTLNQVTINDIHLDADGKVRRNLLSVQVGQDERVLDSLGTRLALDYLKRYQIRISSAGSSPDQRRLRLGKAYFQPLQPLEGGYVRVDNRGYQILSNFLRVPGGFPTVTLTDVLEHKISPNLFQDRIVLIGSIAKSSGNDRFYTPFTVNSSQAWAGVELHANVAAQLIASALYGRPLLRGVAEVGEWGWIFLWSGVGAGLGWSLRTLRGGGLAALISLGSLLALAYGLFLLGWWIVVVSPLLSLLTAALIGRGYWEWYILQQTNQILEQKVEERTQELLEKNDALEHARTALEQANLSLQRLAQLDGLTQLANRRYFDEYLQREWHSLLREQLPLAIVLIDIDFFKLYNDTYGHPAGDECLRQVAWVLQSVAQRPRDLAARYGGEEFVMVLPNTLLEGAWQIAEQARTELQALQLPHRQSPLGYVTLSIGVTGGIPTTTSTPAAFTALADQCLYQAKAQGRDRTVKQPSIT